MEFGGATFSEGHILQHSWMKLNRMSEDLRTMLFEDSLKSLYMVWPLKEKSEEDVVDVFKYSSGTQIQEGTDLISGFRMLN